MSKKTQNELRDSEQQALNDHLLSLIEDESEREFIGNKKSRSEQMKQYYYKIMRIEYNREGEEIDCDEFYTATPEFDSAVEAEAAFNEVYGIENDDADGTLYSPMEAEFDGHDEVSVQFVGHLICEEEEAA